MSLNYLDRDSCEAGDIVRHRTSAEVGVIEEVKTVFSTNAGGRQVRTGYVVVSFGFSQRETLSVKCLTGEPYETSE